jgi:Cof subfamily protein (haloacid dehalogenase superfamily)
MDLKLAISDVDGTITRSDKSLSDEVVAAVGRLQVAGVPLTLISARPPSGMLWIAEKLGIKVPLGAFNGGTIVAPDGKIITAHRLAREVAAKALEMVRRPGVTVWIFNEGRWHAERADGLHDERERKSANQEPVFGGDFDALLGTVDKMVAVSDDHTMLADLDAEVAKALGNGATVGRSQLYYLDITAPAANKGDGITELARAIGVPLESVAVMGDQRNDMPMFARAGLSIAMGQGPEEVRAAATRTTASNDEDGVAKAIDDILIPLVKGP